MNKKFELRSLFKCPFWTSHVYRKSLNAKTCIAQNFLMKFITCNFIPFMYKNIGLGGNTHKGNSCELKYLHGYVSIVLLATVWKLFARIFFQDYSISGGHHQITNQIHLCFKVHICEKGRHKNAFPCAKYCL